MPIASSFGKQQDRRCFPAPVAQLGECWIAELTGSECPVRAASTIAICSWLGLPAVGGSGRGKGKLTSVERGGPCPARMKSLSD